MLGGDSHKTMSRFLLRRLGQALVTVLGVATLVFFVQRLTGDPTYLLVPETATKADIDALRHALGFDRPLLVQYLDFLRDLAHFDLGPVGGAARAGDRSSSPHACPTRWQLAAGALVVARGPRHSRRACCSRMFRDRAIARICAGLVLAAQSMPTFWSGILMIMIFAVQLGWLPPSSTGGFSSLVMPSVTLGLLSMATFARITRTALLDELHEGLCAHRARPRRARRCACCSATSRATPRSR